MEEAHDHRPSSTAARSFFSGFCAAALRRKPLGAHGSAVAATGEGLVRQLGVLELVLLGIGASIGAGIFVITGTVARDAGPGVTISFVLAGAACVLNAQGRPAGCGLAAPDLEATFAACGCGLLVVCPSAFAALGQVCFTCFRPFWRLVSPFAPRWTDEAMEERDRRSGPRPVNGMPPLPGEKSVSS